MKKVALAIFLIVVMVLTSCSSAKKAEPEVAGNVIVKVGDRVEGFETLEAAVASVFDGETAVLTVTADITVTKEIVVANKNITIVNKDGLDVVITDGTKENGPAAVEAGYKVNDVFFVRATGELTLEGNKTGSLTFQGVGKTALPVARSMFIMPKNDGGKITVNPGVIIQGQNSAGGAGVFRCYGTLVINGGIFRDNFIEKSNGCVIFIGLHGSVTINDGEFTNNDAGSSNGGTIQVSNDEGSTLVVNAGTFTGSKAARGAIINSYANSIVTINGGTFTASSATANENGAAVYCLGTFTINGGTFTGNEKFDVYKGADTVKIEGAATIANLGLDKALAEAAAAAAVPEHNHVWQYSANLATCQVCGTTRSCASSQILAGVPSNITVSGLAEGKKLELIIPDVGFTDILVNGTVSYPALMTANVYIIAEDAETKLSIQSPSAGVFQVTVN